MGREIIESTGGPPTTNRGALNTTPDSLRALVDWVQATFKHLTSPSELTGLMGLEINDFVEMNTGSYGWTNCLRCGNIKIFHGGGKQVGLHLEISGQGCRQIEVQSPLDWQKIFSNLITDGASFTRLDVAIDDFGRIVRRDRGLKPYFSVQTLIHRIERGLCRSKFEWGRQMGKIKLDDGSYHGRSIYFGSPQSRLQIRVYEKNWERISKGFELEEGIEVWNRTEVQLRKERAQEMATVIAVGREDLLKTISGVIRNYVEFVDPDPNDSNKGRWPVSKFWLDFLGHVAKLPLASEAPDKTLIKTYEWIKGQTAPSIAKFMHAVDWDVDKLLQVAFEGNEKLKEKDFKQVEREKAEFNKHLWALDVFKQNQDRGDKLRKLHGAKYIDEIGQLAVDNNDMQRRLDFEEFNKEYRGDDYFDDLARFRQERFDERRLDNRNAQFASGSERGTKQN